MVCRLYLQFSFCSSVVIKDPNAWDFSQDLGILALALGSWKVALKKVKILGFQVKSRISNNFYC